MKPGGKDKRTVMVVDDSEVVLELTRSTLEAAGYRVLTRNRPAGCIAAMLQEDPDLVLIDVSMPGVDGDTLVRCFGTAHPTSRSVVLLYSSLPEEALKAKAAASGAHGFIQKTHNPAILLRQVKRWVEPTVTSGTFSSSGAAGGVPMQRGQDNDSPRPSSDDLEPPVASGAVQAGARVLLADADMLVLSEYRKHLAGERLRLEFALSGSQALNVLLGRDPPAIAVLGLDLGDVPGEEVHERVLDRDATWRERLVLVADATQTQRVPYFARRVLRRPVNGPSFRTAVNEALALGRVKSASL
jgi:CheY-like chemotaxis protein